MRVLLFVLLALVLSFSVTEIEGAVVKSDVDESELVKMLEGALERISALETKYTKVLADYDQLKSVCSGKRVFSPEEGQSPKDVESDVAVLKESLATVQSDVAELRSDFIVLKDVTVQEIFYSTLDLGIKIDDLNVEQIRTDLSKLEPTVWGLDGFREELTFERLPALWAELEKLTWALEIAQTGVSELRKDVVPVGFIYVQYEGEAAPGDLWPRAFWWDKVSDHIGYSVFRHTNRTRHI